MVCQLITSVYIRKTGNLEEINIFPEMVSFIVVVAIVSWNFITINHSKYKYII